MDPAYVILLLFFGGLASIVILWINDSRLPGKLRRRGVSIEGRITYRFVVGRSPGYTLVYRYSYHGLTYSRDQRQKSDVTRTHNIRHITPVSSQLRPRLDWHRHGFAPDFPAVSRNLHANARARHSAGYAHSTGPR